MSTARSLAPDNRVGHPAEDYLRAAIGQGSLLLHRLAEDAVERFLAHGTAGIVVGHFFTQLELAQLAEMLAAVIGTAELLGRALVRDREQQVLTRHRGQQESRRRVLEAAPVPRRQQQRGWTCGPAAIRAVAARFGIYRFESEIARHAGADSHDGTRPSELEGTLHALGLRTEARDGLTLADVQHATDRGLPVIACCTMHGGGHWVVIVDAGPDRVLFMDPVDSGYHWLDAPSWESIWRDTDADGYEFVCFGIAVGPKRMPPVSEGRQRWREEKQHDVSGEKRDDSGRWTKGGASAKKTAANKKSAGGDKSKYIGASVGAAEHLHADKVSHSVADWVGGATEEDAGGPGQKDKKPFDVRTKKKAGGFHDIEVKSLLKGKGTTISVHDDALLRKVEHIEANPKNQFHTVAVDERASYSGGEYKDNYSGHRIYYKRGSGRYPLSKMYKVKDEAELKRLIALPEEKLPEAARGRLPPPPPLDELREKAAKDSAARKARDKARKERNADLLLAQARARAQAKKEAMSIRADVAGSPVSGESRIAGSPTSEHREAAKRWADASPGLSPETAAEYVDHLTHALSVLPPGIARDAGESLGHGGVRFHASLKMLREEAQRINGKSAGGVVGFAHDHGMATDLHLDGGDDPRGTYVHELWHAADNGGFHSDDKGWQAAYKKDVLKGRHLLSRYAMTNASEGFAEFGRALATHGLEYMTQRFPTAVKHLKSKGLM